MWKKFEFYIHQGIMYMYVCVCVYVYRKRKRVFYILVIFTVFFDKINVALVNIRDNLKKNWTIEQYCNDLYYISSKHNCSLVMNRINP